MGTTTCHHPEVSPPSALLALTELPRTFADLTALSWAAGPLMALAPRGEGHPVLVLPGFLTTDASTTVLRGFLRHLGHDVRAWSLGRNVGPRAIGADGEKLIAKVREIHAETGQTVSLVGWSLGGVMARLAAQYAPEAVRQVITLGSPFAGSPRATNVWRLYEAVSGQSVDDGTNSKMLHDCGRGLGVPATAIYSRKDGIVAWEICREGEAERCENIEVHGAHCGLGMNAAALYAIADRLALAEGEWIPFQPTGIKAWMYPQAGRG